MTKTKLILLSLLALVAVASTAVAVPQVGPSDGGADAPTAEALSANETCALPPTGCCDGTTLRWCEGGAVRTMECSQNDAPNDVCGWSAAQERFDCGGRDTAPAGVDPACAR